LKLPKIGRFTAGALAAVIALPVTVAVAVLELRMRRFLHWPSLVGVFVGITGGLLWLGEECGVIAEPYRDSRGGPLSLK
jgi:hypothetical protein